MRAHEFIINIPINIKVNSDGQVDVTAAQQDEPETDEVVMVSPLQQELELQKAALGKTSTVIDQITADDPGEFIPESEE